jgi:hypothetical protein
MRNQEIKKPLFKILNPESPETLNSAPSSKGITLDFTKQQKNKLDSLEKKVSDAVNRFEEMQKEVSLTKQMVSLGFIALLFVVIGLVFGYWHFVYGNIIQESQKVFSGEQDKNIFYQSTRINEITDKQKKQEEDLKNLINSNNCIKYTGKFSASCFK